MLFSSPARDFLPTRANIVCFRRSSMSVFLGDRIVCGWVGGHFSSRVAWVSSPPTYLQTINIFDSSEVDVNFSTFFLRGAEYVNCLWVGRWGTFHAASRGFWATYSPTYFFIVWICEKVSFLRSVLLGVKSKKLTRSPFIFVQKAYTTCRFCTC